MVRAYGGNNGLRITVFWFGRGFGGDSAGEDQGDLRTDGGAQHAGKHQCVPYIRDRGMVLE